MTVPTTTKRRTRRGLMTVAILLAAGLATAGALVLGGFLPLGGGTTHPPCDQLPSTAQARAALTANPGLAAQLASQGTGVAVRVGSPGCDNENQSLIEVTYSTDEERDRVDEVLTRSDGFGVPVYVDKE